MKNIIILLMICANTALLSQDSNVHDGDLPEAEFHAVINPQDSNHIVLASIHGFGNEDSGNIIVIYYTFDAGDTWQKSAFNAVYEEYIASGDPVLAFDTNGNLLLVNLAAKKEFSSIDNILSISYDGGATWNKAVDIVSNSFSDKPWITVDHSKTSPYFGNIYIPSVEQNINLHIVTPSLDEHSQTVILDGDALPSVVVNNQGDIFTSTIVFGDSLGIYFQQFTYGGASLAISKKILSIADYTFNAPWISERYQPTVYLAIDNSGGENEGRIYLSYTDSEEIDPDYFDIFLMYSDDNGDSWSTPKVVNQDNINRKQQFYSSIYVNKNGTLIMDWYDRRNYADDNKYTDFYIGISKDGGEHFEESKLSTSYSDFEHVIPSSNDFGIGEYHQVVASNSTAYSFWSDGRTNDGDLNIYMAKVNLEDPSAVKEYNTITNEILISNVSPNPVDNVLKVNIETKKTSMLAIEILSSTGIQVWERELRKYATGKHQIHIPTVFPSGTYYLRIISDKGYVNIKKLSKL